MAVSPDGRYLVTGRHVEPLTAYEIDTGKVVRKFEPHEGTGFCAAFSPDGRQVVSGGGARKDNKRVPGAFLRLWDFSTGQEIRRFEGHKGPVMGVLFTLDGKRIVSVSSDWTARLWDVETGEELASTGSQVEANASSPRIPFALHPNATCFIYGSSLWEIPSLKKLRDLQRPEPGRKSLCATFSPDGKRFLTGNDEGLVRLIDFGTEKQIVEFEAFVNGAEVFTLDLSKDGKTLLTGGEGTIPGFIAVQRNVVANDDKVRLWKLPE